MYTCFSKFLDVVITIRYPQLQAPQQRFKHVLYHSTSKNTMQSGI